MVDACRFVLRRLRAPRVVPRKHRDEGRAGRRDRRCSSRSSTTSPARGRTFRAVAPARRGARSTGDGRQPENETVRGLEGLLPPGPSSFQRDPAILTSMGILTFGKDARRELGSCVFCDRRTYGGREGGEHVYPQWMLKFLGLENNRSQRRVIGPGTRGMPGQPATAEVFRSYRTKSMRVEKFGRSTVWRVCTKCNNEWMSQLEAQAKPILTKLILGGATLGSTLDSERAALAHWMVKTACVFDCSETHERFIPDRVAKLAKEGSAPPGMCLFGTHCENPALAGKALHGQLSSDWFSQAPSPEWFTEIQPHSFKFSFSAGYIVLLLAYWRDCPPWQFAVWNEIHGKPLWQYHCRFTDVKWPRTFDRGHRFPGLEFAATLGVSCGDWNHDLLDHQDYVARLLAGKGRAMLEHPLAPDDLCPCGSKELFVKCHGQHQ